MAMRITISIEKENEKGTTSFSDTFDTYEEAMDYLNACWDAEIDKHQDNY